MAWFITESPWDAKHAVDGSGEAQLYLRSGWKQVTEEEARVHQECVDAYRGFVGDHPLSAQ